MCKVGIRVDNMQAVAARRRMTDNDTNYPSIYGAPHMLESALFPDQS